MAVTAGELLDELQQVAWKTAYRLEVSDPGTPAQRRREAGRLVRGLHEGWPAFSVAAARALRSVPMPLEEWDRQSGAVAALQRSGELAGGGHQPVAADERLQRMGLLLGGVADLFAGLPRDLTPAPAAAVATRDRIAAAVETMTRLAVVCADLAPSSASPLRWHRRLEVAVDELRALTSTHPASRAGVLDDVAAVSADEPSLQGSLQAWRTAATSVLCDAARSATVGPTLGVISIDLALTTRAMGLVLAAGAEHEVIPAELARRASQQLEAASVAWQQAGEQWSPRVRVSGRLDPGVHAAGRAVRGSLREVLLDEAGWVSPAVAAERIGSQRVGAAVQVARRTCVHLDEVGQQLLTGVRRALAGAAVYTPARALTGRGNTPLALVPVAARGGWVPLPESAPHAQALVATTSKAAEATRQARDAAAATAPFPTSLNVRPALHSGAAQGAVMPTSFPPAPPSQGRRR